MLDMNNKMDAIITVYDDFCRFMLDIQFMSMSDIEINTWDYNDIRINLDGKINLCWTIWRFFCQFLLFGDYG